jgi:anti-sigma-K factor RskA
VLDVRGGIVVPFRRRWVPPLAAAAAVAAAAAIAIGLHERGGPGGAAGMRTYAADGAGGGALLVGRSGEAVLVVHGLPQAAPGTAYELWVVRDGRAVRAGFMRGELGVLTRPVSAGASVAVSLEPTGGSRRPTGPLLVRAETA